MTAEERREAILEAALVCFADHGAHGMSTEAIAKAVGISQPYIFRLFGTKKELVKATIGRCMRGMLELFRAAAAGKTCEDEEIREVVRKGFGDLFEYVERASGLPPARVSNLFAEGMLFNVVAAMHL